MSLKNLSVKNKIPKILIEKLDNKKVNLLYKKFEKSFNLNENFIVAVSGGPDCMSLAFFAKIYSIEKKINYKLISYKKNTTKFLICTVSFDDLLSLFYFYKGENEKTTKN